MLNSIETAFKGLLSCLQSIKMYGESHPMFQKSLDSTFEAFREVFSERQEVVIGIVGEELAFEKEILFDLAKFLRPAILYLKERHIERIAFYRGLNREELLRFVCFIAGPKEDFKGDFQASLSLAGVEHISIGRLKVSSGQEEGEGLPDQSELYNSSADVVGQALSGVLNSEKVDQLALKFSLGSIMENFSSQRQEMLKLATVKKYDMGTYVHMLNVSIFSMYFSSRLGFEKADILNIGIAAMYHDIGKLYISRKILHKPGQLTEQEFGNVKSHTLMGAQIMLKYTDTLGILPVVVSFEHHLKYDSSGYPRLPFLRSQHIASMIVSICDVYDALSQRRGYKQDYSPDVVYNIMNKDRGKTFDPELLDKFFKFMGFWPVGAVVALNDESVAIVVSQNESDIRRPKVQIVWPQEKKRQADLLEDQTLSIQRYLNPWKEGKEFLKLA
ncbi:MAG: HD domain-containing protein [Candidatus Omnitrophica bacterium]|jgi:HD-GYP domain-containing protein (c-di-GMP phosphodiesterase class II)|nr:HD domain-containing protein [Candidatus Omnitrophota bacterium]MDD5725422.1 HD domain-containing protein [Candidatus Omnitrophota bacterium]